MEEAQDQSQERVADIGQQIARNPRVQSSDHHVAGHTSTFSLLFTVHESIAPTLDSFDERIDRRYVEDAMKSRPHHDDRKIKSSSAEADHPKEAYTPCRVI